MGAQIKPKTLFREKKTIDKSRKRKRASFPLAKKATIFIVEVRFQSIDEYTRRKTDKVTLPKRKNNKKQKSGCVAVVRVCGRWGQPCHLRARGNNTGTDREKPAERYKGTPTSNSSRFKEGNKNTATVGSFFLVSFRLVFFTLSCRITRSQTRTLPKVAVSRNRRNWCVGRTSWRKRGSALRRAVSHHPP